MGEHLSKLENGEASPGLDMIDRLASALGAAVTDLIPPPAPADLPALRDQVREALGGVIEKAGPELLASLRDILSRLK